MVTDNKELMEQQRRHDYAGYYQQRKDNEKKEPSDWVLLIPIGCICLIIGFIFGMWYLFTLPENTQFAIAIAGSALGFLLAIIALFIRAICGPGN